MTPEHPRVLITGASSGFGEEFARQYAQRGYNLILVARRLELLEKLAETLRQEYKIEVLVEQADLSNIAVVKELHERLTRQGIEIDVLINNAGHGLQGVFLGSKADAILSMIQLDITSLTVMTHLFGQDMKKRKRGQILQVASILALLGVENFAVYSAAKAYVLRLGEALHREFRYDNVTVTTLCPGLSDTGFASVAQQKISPLMRLFMMKPAPVVRAGMRAIDAGRISVVPGLSNKLTAMLMWATPRRFHQAILSWIMNP
ncbi:SDR family NAD(P)-dependent oxidoreductase [Mangrovibacter phragmitis]|uniref:SDR family NAD(P)-dependent oxidoreductase n=1 Tax=Mangrovibacter phragmitis TaxID=1691903 RepID=UPI003519AD07